MFQDQGSFYVRISNQWSTHVIIIIIIKDPTASLKMREKKQMHGPSKTWECEDFTRFQEHWEMGGRKIPYESSLIFIAKLVCHN